MSSPISPGISLAFLSSWISTLTLIFGGCCSNAITLEQITSQYPHAGSLITFFQFILISINGLPKYITFSSPSDETLSNGSSSPNSSSKRWRIPYPRLKPGKIPLSPYLVQVVLFYLINLLNDAAFGYQIPMAVHIIFRSGGLVVNMALGWAMGKRYSLSQILSVLLVTCGVVLTTLSASQPTSKVTAAGKENSSTFTYGIGICILSLALFLSGVLGLAQDLMYSKYGRPGSSTSQQAKLSNKNKNETTNRKSKHPPTSKSDSSPDWQESMFYLHFLSLPMFWFVRQDLATQFVALSAAPKMYLTLPPLPILPSTLHAYLPASLTNTTTTAYSSPLSPTIAIPAPFLPLLLNTLTQLLCVAGVHRLTTSVSSLSVTLVLVVRKAVSLVISVMWLHRGTGEDERNGMLWFGAGMVLVGTVGYSIGSRAGLGKAGKVRSGKTRKVKVKPE